MKTLRFFAQAGVFSAIFFSAIVAEGITYAQPLGAPGHSYVVIGAFAIHKNAINFATYARDRQLDARFEMNQNRQLYYVFVMDTEDKAAAIDEAKRLREDSEFKDTWVYSGPFVAEGISGQDINPDTNQPMGTVTSGDAPQPDGSSTTVTSSAGPPLAETTSLPADASATPETLNDTGEGQRFMFRIFRAADQQELQGAVDMIDPEKSRKVGTYEGNKMIRISAPENKSGKITLICEVFGYRKVQHDIDFANPEGDNISRDENNTVVVPFELARLQKGDIAVMYNVYFFKDAGVMRPESRYEVNSLLEMLKENPNYRIKIHGHTNGGAAGKIISMGKDSNNFFSLTDTKDGFGSAKKLSEERATVIRDYLAANGIDAKRMEVKAWGGKRPIHDKHSTRAQENVRVEIEILQD